MGRRDLLVLLTIGTLLLTFLNCGQDRKKQAAQAREESGEEISGEDSISMVLIPLQYLIYIRLKRTLCQRLS